MPKIHISDIRLAREKVSLLGRLLAGVGIESRLTERQAVVARIYGHVSWAELKAGRSDGLADLTVVDGDRALCIVREAFGIASAEADCIVSELNVGDLRSRSSRLLDRLVLAANDEVTEIQVEREGGRFTRTDRRHGLVSGRGEISHFDWEAILARLEGAAGRKGESVSGEIILGRCVPARYSVTHSDSMDRVCIRIRLSGRSEIPALGELGISGLPSLMTLLANSSGIILFSGSTGSGKTWTTRSCALHLMKTGRKVVIVDQWDENDIEEIPSFIVDRSTDLDAAGLEKLAGFVPDVVVLGLWRSHWRLALELAAGGTLVLMEMHASSASSGVDRLIDLGFSADDVSRHVRGAHHQFLVPRSDGFTTSSLGRAMVSETLSIEEVHGLLGSSHRYGWAHHQMRDAVRLLRMGVVDIDWMSMHLHKSDLVEALQVAGPFAETYREAPVRRDA